MIHERYRKFNSSVLFPGTGTGIDQSFVVRDGNRLHVRGQTARTLDFKVVGIGNPAAQTEQVMDNLETILAEAGGKLADTCKLVIYITDRAWRQPVYDVVARRMKGIPCCSTGLIVDGLADPAMVVEIDAEVVIPPSGQEDHRRIGVYNMRDRGQPIDRDGCDIVHCGDEIFIPGQTGIVSDTGAPIGRGRTVEDAGRQADQAMNNVKRLLERAGATTADVCKLRVYLTDHAYRASVYPVIGRHLAGIHPISTGLIVKGFALPEICVEIDVTTVPSGATPHTRVRPFNTGDWHPAQRKLGCDFCHAVRAGNRVFVIGTTGSTLEQEFVGLGDAGAQADQAMKTIEILLGEAGSSLRQVTKLTTFQTDRAYAPAITRAIAPYFEGVHPARTALTVRGLGQPAAFVEIDLEAVVAG